MDGIGLLDCAEALGPTQATAGKSVLEPCARMDAEVLEPGLVVIRNALDLAAQQAAISPISPTSSRAISLASSW